ncbi:hypothetical protein [Bartonella raoultii]|nr:hypothetical protein [Bartonella raoultii]
MITDKPQAEHESFKIHENAQYRDVKEESKVCSFKKTMMLSKTDYKIIFCITIVMLILGSIRAVSLPIFLFGLFSGRIYVGGGGFFDFIVFLPTFIWGLSIIFLPVVLVLHFILDKRLKKMLQKLEKSSKQQSKSGTVEKR